MTITLNQALTIYNWFLIAILIVILLMIARFYELRTHERTFYRVFILPLTFFGLASIRIAYLDQIDTDKLATGLWLIGGIFLIVLCVRLYYLMTNNR